MNTNKSDKMSQIMEFCEQSRKIRLIKRKLVANVINGLFLGSYMLLINLLLLQHHFSCAIQSTSSWTNYQQSLNNASRPLQANNSSHSPLLLTIFNTTSVHYEPPSVATTTVPTLRPPDLLISKQNITAIPPKNNPTIATTTTAAKTTIATITIPTNNEEIEEATSTTETADSDLDTETTTSSTATLSDDDDDQTTSSGGKLVKTLSETASDAADKLVERLKPNRVDESDSESDSSVVESSNDGNTSENTSVANAEDESVSSEEKTPFTNDLASNPMESASSPAATTSANSITTLQKDSKLISSNRLARDNNKLVNGINNNNKADKLVLSNLNISSNSVETNNLAKESEKLRSLELKYALDTYEIWRSSGEDLIELISRKLLPLVMEHGYEVDPVTVTGLLQVFNGLRGLKPWAMKLLDASTKLSPGILLGTQSDFGDYDECLNVRVDDPAGLGLDMSQVELDPETNLPQSTIVGKYCLADVEFPKPPREFNSIYGNLSGPIELLRPLYDFAKSPSFRDTIWVETANFFHMLYVDPIRSAICLTNKIDPESFSQVFNKVFAEFRVKINFRGRCVTKYDKREWTIYQKISGYFITIACSLVILSTLLEFFAIKLEKIPFLKHKILDKFRQMLGKFFENNKQVLTSFSLLRNTKRLFKVPRKFKNAESENQLNKMIQQQSQASITSSSISSSLESSPQIDRRSSSATSNSANGDLQSTIAGSACQLLSYNQKKHDGQMVKLQQQQQSLMIRPTSLNYHAEREFNYQKLDLNCLHGIRVITMTWMIVNHTYMFGGFFVLWAHRRLIDIAEWPKSLSFQLVLNGWLTVETYFFLSALIIIINVMPLMRQAKFSYVNFIIHRLIRLVPAYAGLVALNFLWPLISSGPVWLVKGRDFIQYPCENYLWTNFLFINNWIWPEKQVSFSLLLDEIVMIQDIYIYIYDR